MVLVNVNRRFLLVSIDAVTGETVYDGAEK
jgi:hypothetical protein